MTGEDAMDHPDTADKSACILAEPETGPGMVALSITPCSGNSRSRASWSLRPEQAEKPFFLVLADPQRDYRP